eukprot:19729_1
MCISRVCASSICCHLMVGMRPVVKAVEEIGGQGLVGLLQLVVHVLFSIAVSTRELEASFDLINGVTLQARQSRTLPARKR